MRQKQLGKSIYARPAVRPDSANLPWILSGLLAVFVFADARVLISSLIKSDILAKFVYGMFWLLLCGFALRSAIRLKSKFGHLLIVHVAGSFAIYLTFGMPLSNFVQLTTAFAACVAIAGVIKTERDVMTIMRLFGLATLINLYAVYDPTGWLSSAIAQQSQQGSSYYYDELGLYNAVRGAGFLVAPAGLSLFGGMALAIGLVMLSYEYKSLWLWLDASGPACGIAASNRSFIVMVGALVLLLPAILGVRRKHFLVWFGFIICLGLGTFILNNNSTYIERLVFRFNSKNMEEAVGSRIYGEASSLVILQNLTFRMILIGDTHFSSVTSSMIINANGREIRPHNGIVQILGTRGIFFLALYCYLLGSTARYLWNQGSRLALGRMAYLNRAMFAALLMGGVISLFESLLESSLMLLIIGIVTGLRVYGQHYSPDSKGPYVPSRLIRGGDV